MLVVWETPEVVEKTVYKGVVWGALYKRICLRRLRAAKTGHKMGCPERPRPTSSPLMPFFCVVNSRAMCVTVLRSFSGQVNASRQT